MEKKKTNVEVLAELHDKAAALIDAMLPVLASELGVPVGDVEVDICRRKAYAAATAVTFRGGEAIIGIGRGYSHDPRTGLILPALASLKQSIIDVGFEAAEKEASDEE